MVEYVDHLHEHFLDPVRMRGGRYLPPERPATASRCTPSRWTSSSSRGCGVEVVIVTPIRPEQAERIGAEEGVELTYLPELLPTERWSNDGSGEGGIPFDDPRWAGALTRAEVVWGIPDGTGDGLVDLLRRAPRLEWVQARNAGAGEQLGQALQVAPEDAHASRSPPPPASTPVRWPSSRSSASSPSPRTSRPCSPTSANATGRPSSTPSASCATARC